MGKFINMRDFDGAIEGVDNREDYNKILTVFNDDHLDLVKNWFPSNGMSFKDKF